MKVMAGVIRIEDIVKMKRMIFRVSKGKAMPTFFDFPDFERNIMNDNSGESIFAFSEDKHSD